MCGSIINIICGLPADSNYLPFENIMHDVTGLEHTKLRRRNESRWIVSSSALLSSSSVARLETTFSSCSVKMISTQLTKQPHEDICLTRYLRVRKITSNLPILWACPSMCKTHAVAFVISLTPLRGSAESGQRRTQGANTMARAFGDIRFDSSCWATL